MYRGKVFRANIKNLPLPITNAYKVIYPKKRFLHKVLSKVVSLSEKFGILRPYIHTRQECTFEKVEISPDRIVEQLYQYPEMLFHVYHKDIKMIVIGAKQAGWIMEQIRPMVIAIPDIICKDGIQTLRLSGISVMVLPWFDGIVPVPDID